MLPRMLSDRAPNGMLLQSGVRDYETTGEYRTRPGKRELNVFRLCFVFLQSSDHRCDSHFRFYLYFITIIISILSSSVPNIIIIIIIQHFDDFNSYFYYG